MDPELWDLLDICPVCGWPRPDACECPGGGEEWSNQVNEELLKQAYDAKQRWLEAEGELAVWERNWPDATETRDALEQVAKDLYEAWREAEKRATK